jgi:hypothetical protein
VSHSELRVGWEPTTLTSVDCELAALGRFLHRRGLLDRGDIDEVNSRVGRTPGTQDLYGFAFELMLGAGCDRITIFDSPLLLQIEPYEQWLEAVAEVDPHAADTATYRRSYELATTAVQSIGDIYRRDPGRFHHQKRAATNADIVGLLAGERNVAVVDFGGGQGWRWGGTVSGTVAPGRYGAFETRRGQFEVDAGVFADLNGKLALQGWRAPR